MISSKNDFFIGLITIVMSIIGFYGVFTSDLSTESMDLIGPLFFPKFILSFLFILGLYHLYLGIRIKDNTKYWTSNYATKKIFTFIALFIFYILFIILLKNITTNISIFENNTSFIISTIIYLLISLYITGRRRIIEYLAISTIVPLLSVLSFVYGFDIVLP